MSPPKIPRALLTHYTRILRRWPTDILRPLTFQRAMRQRLQTRYLLAAPRPEDNVVANEALVSIPRARAAPDERDEMEQVNALYSLLENRYSRTYETSEESLRPAWNPSYYTDLAREMEEAPRRGWLRRQWLRWSRIVRFS